MDRIYLDDAVLISVQSNSTSEKGSQIKFLTGKVINDKTKRFQVGRFLITLQLELLGNDVFLTKNGEIFETSNSPSVTEVSCAELLLMRISSFELEQILSIRDCKDNAKLLSAFDY
jgi:hypothetical protein